LVILFFPYVDVDVDVDFNHLIYFIVYIFFIYILELVIYLHVFSVVLFSSFNLFSRVI